jgi:DNA-binding transcriptional LysR family regulator
MDRFEAMSIFILTVDKGSLTAAAKALHMPLPTVSRKVSELESHLGTKLLKRSTRKLSLTDSGERYLASARRIMNELVEVEQQASGEYASPRGDLVLTTPFLFGQRYILPIVNDFLAQYPEINIRLLLSDSNVHLVDEHVDMAVRLGALPDSRIVATRVGSMASLVCASPETLAAHGRPKHPDELGRLPCIVFTGPATSSWSFRDPDKGSTFDVRITPRLAVTSAAAAVQSALAGTGFTRVYRYHCHEEIKAGYLIPVLQGYDVKPFPVHLVHAAPGRLPLKMRIFLDVASERLRKSLAQLS